ncbi:MAG: DUF5709 domain-containing protein [Propionicimonas sp.]|uniref:DUF5709 domain-containing protein n=1 Tax=Propionicimonas sp. TaxID=1955623 RepID=UPI003D11A9BE
MTDYDEAVPEEAEQLDQLQPDETLLDRGVDDVLDEGYVTGENWSPAQGFGNTAKEMRQGETLEMRIAQELPEQPVKLEGPWNPDASEPREVGKARAGRLVDANGGVPGLDTEAESVGSDVGIDGGAATAEEAAMHIIDDYDDDDDD